MPDFVEYGELSLVANLDEFGAWRIGNIMEDGRIVVPIAAPPVPELIMDGWVFIES